MLTRGLRIIDLSDRIGTTYETARKLVKGQVLPSRPLVVVLSKVLGLGTRELRRAVAADRAHRVSPRLFWLQPGMNPELELLYLEWEYLNDEERKRITDFALNLATKYSASQSSSELQFQSVQSGKHESH